MKKQQQQQENEIHISNKIKKKENRKSDLKTINE